MSRVKPILFNTDMVRAILDGRKTVTRRVVKDDACIIHSNQEINKNLRGQFELYNITPRCGIPQGIIFKSPCQPGDILYVRETWNWNPLHEYGTEPNKYIYRADYDGHAGEIGWHPSLHMPKEAARIWLKVTDVRVEQLREITEEQAEKEGCNDYTSTALGFCYLWDSTLKKSDIDRYGWDASPWVWVIEFERCEKSESEE